MRLYVLTSPKESFAAMGNVYPIGTTFDAEYRGKVENITYSSGVEMFCFFKIRYK